MPWHKTNFATRMLSPLNSSIWYMITVCLSRTEQSPHPHLEWSWGSVGLKMLQKLVASYMQMTRSINNIVDWFTPPCGNYCTFLQYTSILNRSQSWQCVKVCCYWLQTHKTCSAVTVSYAVKQFLNNVSPTGSGMNLSVQVNKYFSVLGTSYVSLDK